MKAYYESKGKNVFDNLPVTFHVKRYNDDAWNEFTKYYAQDIKNSEGAKRLWIVKPGENTNRGNGITIHNDYQKIKQLVEGEISCENSKKTFIIQKYIDRPFLYNKRKFDIRCYMLLVRLVSSKIFRTKRSKDIGTMKAISAQVASNFNSMIARMSLCISPTMLSKSTVTNMVNMKMAIS